MGKKEKTLESILTSTNLVTKKAIPYLNYELVAKSEFVNEVDRIYRKLGGILPIFPVNFRGWDIEFDGIGVELDEQLHFNRYRAITLQSEIYSNLLGFPLDAYVHYCEAFESACLNAGKHGGKWTNPSCEKQFGVSGKRGDLSGAGAARWKQRAFYDFVKDLSSLIIGVPVARISIWDNYGNNGELVNELLQSEKKINVNEMVSFVRTHCF